MIRKLLPVFYFLMSNIGIFRFFYWINRHKKIILTYHNIIPDHLFDNGTHLGMSHRESIFEKHIKLLQRRFMHEQILITFDDGYKNQSEIAAKILEKYGLQGIFFITFQLIENQKPLTIDNMLKWISYVPVGYYQVFDMKLTITKENRHCIALKLYEKLLSNYLLWGEIEKKLDHACPFSDLIINVELNRLRFEPMKPNDLETLKKNKHTIAAHSWDHYPLSTLPIEMQKKDFSLCMVYAMQYCNSRLYSYPYGGKKEVSPMTISLCKEYGFCAAYMNNQVAVNFPGEDMNYQLPRLSLPNHYNFYILDAKLSGFEFFCKTLIKNIIIFFRIEKWKKESLSIG